MLKREEGGGKNLKREKTKKNVRKNATLIDTTKSSMSTQSVQTFGRKYVLYRELDRCF